jgi:polysaccharide export outer membrane protein
MHRKLVGVLLGGLLTATGCAERAIMPDPHRDAAVQGEAQRGQATPSGAARTETQRASAAPSPASAGLPPGLSLADLPRPAAPPAAAATAAASEGDYLLAPRDQIAVQVYGQDDLTRTVRIDQEGNIVLPLIGSVTVGGLTIQAAQERIEAQLKNGGYLLNPKVTVAVAEFQGRQYAVMGGVNQPGTYTLKANQISLMSAISEARGVRDTAEQTAYIVRARPRPDEAQPLRVDLSTMHQSGDTGRVMVEPGDVVYVPEDNTFYVAGEVEKRGAYTLRRDMTLSKAITEAGGVSKTAATDRITLIRTLPNGEKKEITGIDLETIVKGDRTADLKLQSQDVVVVPTSGAKVVGYGFLDFLRGIFSIGVGIPIIP